jgi:hypothetical protein
MLKKGVVGLLLMLCGIISRGQVVFNINSTNIKQTSLSLDQATTYYTSPLISLVPSITVRTDAGFLTGNTLPVNLFTAKIIGTGGNLLNVLSSSQTVTLSGTAQNAYGQLLSLLHTGAINWRYGFQGWAAYAMQAGTYSVGLNFGTGGLGQGTLTPAATTLTVNVDAFINQSSSLTNVQFKVNSLNYFRSLPLSSANDVAITTTVPYGTRIRTTGARLNYSNGSAGVPDPQTSTGNITARLTTAGTTKSINLQNVFQNLTPAGGAAIPAGNQPLNTVTIAINPSDLKAAFSAKGQYQTSLFYEIFDAQATALAPTVAFTCPLTITVDELAELKVNQTDVSLSYNSAVNYAQGVKSDVPGHLTLSSTIPYDVYVKANAANMVNGTQAIPVSLIDVTPLTPVKQATLATVSLSTIPQKIISGGMPEIDLPVDIRYAIPASRSSQLLNKAAGSYSTTVTYSFVAP